MRQVGTVQIKDSDGNKALIENNALRTTVEYAHTLPADYYLYRTVATPSITASATIGDKTLTVDSITNVAVGDAITIYEDETMFQTVIAGASGTTITLQSGVDYAFTSSATVECGEWNLNVDGSTTPVVFSIKAPPSVDMDIHTVNVSMLDSTDMDDGKFGGASALTNGIVFNYIDGITKNLALIVNNIGFWEIGFSVTYASKAPAGQYGMTARRVITEVNGTTLYLEKGGSAKFQLIVNDDLTGLDTFAVTVNGHLDSH